MVSIDDLFMAVYFLSKAFQSYPNRRSNPNKQQIRHLSHRNVFLAKSVCRKVFRV